MMQSIAQCHILAVCCVQKDFLVRTRKARWALELFQTFCLRETNTYCTPYYTVWLILSHVSALLWHHLQRIPSQLQISQHVKWFPTTVQPCVAEMQGHSWYMISTALWWSPWWMDIKIMLRRPTWSFRNYISWLMGILKYCQKSHK